MNLKDQRQEGQSIDPLNSPRPERTQIMTPKEAAKYLGLHIVTIYRLLKKREIPGTKIGGQWRFKKDLLDAWLSSRMNSAEG
jgi:excisionase family DNA binding protein